MSRRMKGELKGEVVCANHAAQGFYQSRESREVGFASTSRGGVAQGEVLKTPQLGTNH
jgi:hypothetical protein